MGVLYDTPKGNGQVESSMDKIFAGKLFEHLRCLARLTKSYPISDFPTYMRIYYIHVDFDPSLKTVQLLNLHHLT